MLKRSTLATMVMLAGTLGAACSNQDGGPAVPGTGGATVTTAASGGAISGGGATSAGGSTSTSGGAGGATTGGTAGAKLDAAAGGQAGGTTAPGNDAAPGLDVPPPRDATILDGRGGTTGTGGKASTGGAGPAGGTTGTGGTATADAASDARANDAAPDAAAPGDAGDRIVTFKNGGFWNDTHGKRIEAHGGGFYKEGDTWYWIGEDKSATPANPKAWVNLYASKDLVTWEFRNSIITRNTSPELAAADRVIERPKLLYNASTKQYVVWLHYENSNYSTASAGVFKSATIDGDYSYVKAWKPFGNMSRDCNVFKDDDGKAYFMSSANENADMMLYELTEDYLDIKQLTIKLWAGAKREAPALFKVDGTYFFITSACTSWDPNQAQYATATNIAGPWTSLTNVGNSTTFDTQPTYVIPVVGSEATTYIYASDRWQDPDLPSSKYIWLPLIVKGTKLGMDFHDQWSLDLTTGRWTAGNSRTLPKDAWKLVSVDSEETSAEDDRGAYAFDGLSSTFWHSKYTGGVVNLPHEIQIDLGASYSLTEFAYLPRQDDNLNGVVGQYELYLGTDTTNWGTAVKAGTFAADASEKVVTFPAKVARYLRFRALSEVQGKQYTAVAELSVVGTAQ